MLTQPGDEIGVPSRPATWSRSVRRSDIGRNIHFHSDTPRPLLTPGPPTAPTEAPPKPPREPHPLRGDGASIDEWLPFLARQLAERAVGRHEEPLATRWRYGPALLRVRALDQDAGVIAEAVTRFAPLPHLVPAHRGDEVGCQRLRALRGRARPGRRGRCRRRPGRRRRRPRRRSPSGAGRPPAASRRPGSRRPAVRRRRPRGRRTRPSGRWRRCARRSRRVRPCASWPPCGAMTRSTAPSASSAVRSVPMPARSAPGPATTPTIRPAIGKGLGLDLAQRGRGRRARRRAAGAGSPSPARPSCTGRRRSWPARSAPAP